MRRHEKSPKAPATPANACQNGKSSRRKKSLKPNLIESRTRRAHGTLTAPNAASMVRTSTTASTAWPATNVASGSTASAMDYRPSKRKRKASHSSVLPAKDDKRMLSDRRSHPSSSAIARRALVQRRPRLLIARLRVPRKQRRARCRHTYNSSSMEGIRPIQISRASALDHLDSCRMDQACHLKDKHQARQVTDHHPLATSRLARHISLGPDLVRSRPMALLDQHSPRHLWG